MQPVLLICVVLAVLGTLSNGERIGSNLIFGNSALGSIRGGARGGNKGKKSKPIQKQKVSRSRNDDDNEDDDEDNQGNSANDEDDDEEDKETARSRSTTSKRKSKNESKGSKGKKQYSSRNSKASNSKSKGNGAMQLIPWATSKQSGGGKKKKNSLGLSSLKDSLQGIAKTGQAAYKDLYRKAKVLKSSAFEGILLKATWPGNEAVPADLLSEIVKYSIPSFKYARSDSEDDPYYMTLHKLWTKMCEKDWRTVTKSLYILHCISRDSSAEACANFATAIKDMSKTRNPKKPDHKYFELKRLTSDLDDNSVSYDSFISAYGAYVVQRAKVFSGKFEELKSVTAAATEKKVVGLLKKAQSLVTAALACDVEKKNRNAIDGQAIRLVAMDLKDIWQLYAEKLSPWLSTEGSRYVETKEAAEDIKKALTFFKENDGKVKEYLVSQSKAFAKLRVKIPTLENTATSATAATVDSVNSRLEELLKLSGGASSSASSSAASKKTVSQKKNVKRPVVEEDDDEEESDEEDYDDDENFEEIEDDEEDEDDEEELDEEDDEEDEEEADDDMEFVGEDDEEEEEADEEEDYDE